MNWIAIDWGTTHLRGWLMSSDNQVIAQAQSEAGMARLSTDRFEAAFLALAFDWMQAPVTQVVACGMVGARQGWVEAPYSFVPAAPMQMNFTRARNLSKDYALHIIPGMAQKAPPDVMRGEETQIAGFLTQNPSFDGVICLPGSHTKWCQISAGEVVSFRTAMTGELFASLAENSVLRHSVQTADWDDVAFDAAISDALARPEALAVRLFELRAKDLLTGLSAQQARAALSGYLIGAELAAMRPYWLGQNVALIGAPQLSKAYARALRSQGLNVDSRDATEMTVAGLCRAYELIKASEGI